MKKITPICLLLALAVAGCQSDEQAANQSPTQNAEVIAQHKQGLAKQLSTSYADIEQTLKSQISDQNLTISLSTLLIEEPESSFTQQMYKADTSIRTMKGVSAYTDELLEVRLADKSMVQEWKDGMSPLFAFEPKGDDESWQYIEAYDIHGQLHQLDAYKMPDVPVFVVDNNSAKELKAGLQAMQAEMQKLGQPAVIQGDSDTVQQTQLKSSFGTSSAAPISTTAIKKIRLADDEEPWISGKAEVYAIVTGVNPSRDEPTLDLIEMPYLDYDNKDYYPNQIAIHWSRYRWGAADMILMEQDDGSDYKELAKLLVKVAEEVLKMIPDPEVQAYAIIPQITGKIIAAIPDGLLVNDDDYVDVYYTLMQDTSYVDHPGAGGNAIATFEPLTISPTRP